MRARQLLWLVLILLAVGVFGCESGYRMTEADYRRRDERRREMDAIYDYNDRVLSENPSIYRDWVVPPGYRR